jgi:DNA-binding beta-propeller fold protein YncE
MHGPAVRWTAVPFSILLTLLLWGAAAWGEIAVVAVDTKVKLVNGVVTVVPNPPPDYVAVIDLQGGTAKVLAEIPAPTSVVGPPFSVAITPDETLALVSAAMKVDPTDATKQVPDSKISVIDLTLSPPKVIAQFDGGKAASGIAINRAGTLALMANRNEGTVSVFTIHGKEVKPAGKVQVGDEKSGVSMVAITPDGKSALVTMDGDSGQKVAILAIDGSKVEYTKKDIRAGYRPFAIDIHPKGHMAVVTNIGGAGGDIDTISVIDLSAKSPRVVDTISLGGSSPEGIRLSKDGNWCAVALQDNSNKVPNHPYRTETGRVLLYKVDGTKLTKTSEAPIGHWSQGAEFSADGKTLLVGNMVETQAKVFRIEGGKLTDTGQPVTFRGGAVAIRTADRQ